MNLGKWISPKSKPGLYEYKHLLVLVDTLMGWAEALPSAQKQPRSEIDGGVYPPDFGFPLLLGSDNGSAFTDNLSQLLSKALNHSMCHPRSWGKIEGIHGLWRTFLTKFTLETGGDWADFLPSALLVVLRSLCWEKFTPYKTVFGRPALMFPRVHSGLLPECPNLWVLKRT